ncbi:MAG TPA: TetR/AcrR family transcriptional regulator [Bacteroidia bacterium]|nr:TetR/AcrR family transcriptional regulator [Bacteroidia bacterium]
MQTLFKILEGSEHLFQRYGIKSITMDDVARELGMSKKTLYQYVTDKNDLVEKTLEFHLQRSRHACEMMIEEMDNPIDSMLGIGNFFSQHMRDTSPALMYDLRKYHQSAWQKLDEYRENCIIKQIAKNIEKGIADGYYRSDINIEIVPRLYVAMVDAVLERRNFNRDTPRFEDLVNELYSLYLHGIVTPKGLEYLKQKNF